MARVAIKPAEPAPPAGEDPTEAEHKLKLKSKEPLPWSTSPPVPVFGVLAPVETSPLRKSPAPAVSAPAPVVELPPLLSSFARARPPRIKVDPVAVVISIVGLLVFSGVVYLTYRKHVVGPAVSPPVSTMTPAIAPESTTAINPGVKPASSAPARVPSVLAPADSRSAPRPVLTARDARFHFFIDKLKVSGIRTGPPPRLFIDGLTYKPGDVVDQRLGIVFIGLDVTKKEIVFKDDLGTVIRRRF